MLRTLRFGALIALALVLAHRAAAQDSKAAATTRKNLQQKVSLDLKKEIGLKDFLENELVADLDKPIHFKIDNGSGVSNNMKVAYSGKNITVEKVLNDLADKYDFGYYVVSNAANNKVDGKVMIRKSSKGKERGFEAGKEPKDKGASEKQSSLVPARVRHAAVDVRDCRIEPAEVPQRREWLGL
jgi:hypothetical protein